MEDNLYKNDGEWFAQPTSKQIDDRDEKTKLQQARPLVKDVIERLNSRIDFYSSIDSVTVSLQEEPATYQRVLEANRLVRELLISEREYIMQLLEASKE